MGTFRGAGRSAWTTAAIKNALERGASFERDGDVVRSDEEPPTVVDERPFRRAVADLRRVGYPVVSESSRGSRWRKARNHGETEEFVAVEIVPRIRALRAQAAALCEHIDATGPRAMEE